MITLAWNVCVQLQDGELVPGPASEPEAAEAPVVDADMHFTEADPAPAVSAQPATEQAPLPMLVPVAEAIMPSSLPAPVRPAVPSLPTAAEPAPAIPGEVPHVACSVTRYQISVSTSTTCC